ncbi:RNA polymerase subunit sigma-70 [Methylobacterium sp. ID0610]|uniref:RNA polymerase subunit sigma-70 n=1 Tax=Methylobacterium carpenticola TaxID=3344827 RepID=UPI0036B807EC
MTTLKEFEDALREQGMLMALAILEKLRERDRATRTVKPGRRIVGKKMTPELARTILELHGSTDMTQQEIAFKLGVNQGRVNEVIKRGKWLSGDQAAPEAVARDKGKARIRGTDTKRPRKPKEKAAGAARKPKPDAQLAFGDL